MLRTKGHVGPRVAVLLAALLVASGAIGTPKIALRTVTGGLASPVDVTHAGDGSGRLFVAERAGVIRILDGDALKPTPFLDIQAQVLCCAERGLLGLVFHPDYETNGYFFVNYTIEDPDPIALPGVVDGDTIVARYQVSGDPDVADPGSEEILLTIPQPYSNHNGGQLQFGPDGYLYIATGDGGSGGDPDNNGQKLDTLLGKLLRIDVDSGAPYSVPADNPFVGDSDALDEIWAYGLRNPWRFSFDRATGDMFIADVGQGSWEEVDYQPAASAGGENYGWRCREGAHDFNATGCGARVFVEPILEYSHSEGCSITGGYRYRGSRAPSLLGIYFYGDFCSGRIWGAYRDGAGWTTAELLSSGLSISTFGEDEDGEIYVADLGGALYQIVAKPLDELVTDFGASGLWHYAETSWMELTGWDALHVARGDDSIAASFGPGRGLWVYQTTSWTQLTPWDAYQCASWRDRWLAAFDGGRGLWLFESSTWRQLTSWEPQRMAPWGELAAVDFGAGRGLWLYGDAGWRFIASWSAERIVVHGRELVVDFGVGRGLWTYDGSSWQQISPWDPGEIASGTGELFVGFAGRGLYRYDSSTWTELTLWVPELMVIVGDEPAASFGSGRGVWTYAEGVWTQISAWDATDLEAMGDELAGDFGLGRGIWHYASGWTALASPSSESMNAADLF